MGIAVGTRSGRKDRAKNVGGIPNFTECGPHHIFPPYIKALQVSSGQGVLVVYMLEMMRIARS